MARNLSLGWSLLLSSLLLVSCAHTNRYREPALPPGELATLEARIPVWIVAIDGFKVADFGFSDRKQLHVAPGQHQVTLAYAGETRFSGVMPPGDRLGFPSPREVGDWLSQPVSIRASSQEVIVGFEVQRGRTYVASALVEGSQWTPRITECEKSNR